MDLPIQSPPFLNLQWSGRSDTGPVRKNNEDAFIGLQFDAREIHHLGVSGQGETGHMDFAFAVSDGMGGAKAGEYASRIAMEKMTILLPRAYRQSAAGLQVGFPDLMEELFGEIHQALAYLGATQEECTGMETTLSLCWFTPHQMYFGHIGDSRIYYLGAKAKRIKQLTEDDTYVGWLLRNGKINEREARAHPRRNMLQKALGGTNQFVSPQVGAVSCVPGDIFLICSDGLVKGLYDDQLGELLRSKESNLAPLLVQESLAKDGTDNTTAVVIRIS